MKTPCDLCGDTNATAPAVVNWAGWRPGHGPAYDSIIRCLDHSACRARVEESGKTWMLRAPQPPTIALEPRRRLANRVEAPDPELSLRQ